MRKILISLLLASAAASPAIAGPRDWSDRQQAREDRQQAHEDRQQARDDHAQAREERASPENIRAERPAFAPPPRAEQPREQFVGRQSFAGGQQLDPRGRGQPQVDPSQFSRPNPGPRAVYVDQFRNQQDARREALAAQRNQRIDQAQQRFDEREQARDLRQSTRPMPNVMRDRHPLIVSDTPRPGTQPPLRVDNYRRSPEVQWNTGWRNNQRYDWQNYRRHHRSMFHIGFYYDPFGWGYQPFEIGWRLWPAYYGNRYWINDPWMYRLPYAPPGYVWVRYWDDALLVDTWSGTVVDMIPQFFW